MVAHLLTFSSPNLVSPDPSLALLMQHLEANHPVRQRQALQALLKIPCHQPHPPLMVALLRVIKESQNPLVVRQGLGVLRHISSPDITLADQLCQHLPRIRNDFNACLAAMVLHTLTEGVGGDTLLCATLAGPKPWRLIVYRDQFFCSLHCHPFGGIPTPFSLMVRIRTDQQEYILGEQTCGGTDKGRQYGSESIKVPIQAQSRLHIEQRQDAGAWQSCFLGE